MDLMETHHGDADNSVAEWLSRQFLVWQVAQGKRKTLGDFARYLGVKRTTLEKWLYGARVPGRRYADKIAAKLGPEIYDLLRMPRPDPRLTMVIDGWGRISDSDREDIARRFADYLGHGAEPAVPTGDRTRPRGAP